MKKFEGIFILKEKIKAKEIENITKTLLEGVKLYTIEYKGVKDLAYSIKRHKRGNFVVIYFEGTDEQKSQVELRAKDIDDILKFIVINYK